jgi:hypothetical protein
VARDSRYKPGDNYLIDDVTGGKIRSSEARTQWDGLVVHDRVYERRHPQDYVRGVKDHQVAEIVRSEPLDEFIGPLTVTVSEAASPGGIMLRVSSSAGMRIGDTVMVTLDTGDVIRTTITSLFAIGYLTTEDGDFILTEEDDFVLWEDQTDNLGVIGIADKLPYGVGVGNWVVNTTAMAEATLP